MCPTFPALLPLPRLTLKLSNSTFLDTVLLDARDATPLFTVETLANHTALYPAVAVPAADGRLLAAVHWPSWPCTSTTQKQHQKRDKVPVVSIDRRSLPSSAFLKKSVLGGSRKFHVPGQSHPLKWKHVGNHWECTLCTHACTAHRAIATFEPAHTTSAARLNVYADTVVASRPYADTGSHARYDGVDMDMLAYLVLTSILLTTQPHAWRDLDTGRSPMPVPIVDADKYSQRRSVYPVVPSCNSPCNSPSPSPSTSYKPPRIDLLSDDIFPPTYPPLRGSPTSQSSSCGSSLPPSPLTPSVDLSPIHHDTFGLIPTTINTGCTAAGGPSTTTTTSTPSVFRRNSRNSNRMPSPLVTCSTFSNSSSSGNSPTTTVATTPSTPAGPSAITPYHLPPAPLTPSTSLHPRQHLSSTRQQQQQRSNADNALHLDTAHVVASPVLPYTTQLYNIQFAGEAEPQSNRVPANDELPPAYNEIEWTVRVKQPRNVRVQ